MTRLRQQTVESARRADTGDIILAPELLSMTEQEFVLLRRAATEARQHRKRGEAGGTFLTCSVCGTHLYLSRGSCVDGERNRFFRHASPALCPWYDPSRFTAEQIMALRFHGQREGREHLALKATLARALNRDPECAGSVVVDQVQLGEVLKGEWKKPDVRCVWRDKKIVFELQLSYTFITEIVKRDLFYAAERSFILWVFARPSPGRAVQIDEEYYNKRNLFLLDEDAQLESERQGRLILTCWHTIPRLDEATNTLVDEVAVRQVGLSELQFPLEGFRPYYFDYDAACATVESERAAVARRRLEAARIAQAAQRPRLEPAPPPKQVPEPNPPAEVGGPSPLMRALLQLGVTNPPTFQDFLSELINYSRRGLRGLVEIADLQTAASLVGSAPLVQAAQASLKYPYLEALQRILTVRLGEVLVTKYSTVYQVLDAALQPSAAVQRPFAFLYLEAWHAYQPPMKPEQRRRLNARREEVRRELETLDSPYRPKNFFRELVGKLFPEIEPAIAELRGGQAVRPSEADARGSFVWSTPFEQHHARTLQAIQRYQKNYSSVDWKRIVKDAFGCHQDRFEPRGAAGFAALAQSVSRPHVIKFLSECGMIKRV